MADRTLDAAIRRWARRASRRRSAAVVLGPGLIITIFLALATVGVIVGSQSGWFAAVRIGADHIALQNSLDRVAETGDHFWASHAADRYGRRTIDLERFCRFANSELAAEAGLTVRTLAIADSGLIGLGISPQTDPNGNNGEAAEMLSTPRPVTGPNGTTKAHCPISTHVSMYLSGVVAGSIQAAATADIVVGGSRLGNAQIMVPGAVPRPSEGDTTVKAPTLSTLADVGLASSRAVWIAQYHGWTDTGPNADVPAGTATSAGTANEVLVFGGVAADGTSFCLIKVFDANNRSKIGNYRYSKRSSGTEDLPFAVCGLGINTPGIVLNNGWPVAR